VGKDRERVIEKHSANPRAPCACEGCAAFEAQVREFERCARCKRGRVLLRTVPELLRTVPAEGLGPAPERLHGLE
jgi:hypothetical protein